MRPGGRKATGKRPHTPKESDGKHRFIDTFKQAQREAPYTLRWFAKFRDLGWTDSWMRTIALARRERKMAWGSWTQSLRIMGIAKTHTMGMF